MTQRQRETVAAYLLDRADKYVTASPCWIALADAAENVINGEIEQMSIDGHHVDGDLVQRVQTQQRR